MKNEGIIIKIFTTLVVVLLAIGCTQATQTDLEGLKAMRDVWQSAYDMKDAALIAEIYSENGAVMPPNSESANGRAAIKDFFTEFHATGMGVEIQDTEAYAHGDVGYKVDVSGWSIDNTFTSNLKAVQ